MNYFGSQKLVRNPKTRPLLEALDYAQRNNTIGSLSAEDVSSTITAPTVIAKSSLNSQVYDRRIVVENHVDNNDSMAEYAETMRRLQERLDEPFVTVNTVTGDFGSKKAQDYYEKLIRNKTPKSRR